jgi:hypothetical protein
MLHSHHFLIVAVAVLATAAQADTIYVDDDNCPGPGSGTLGDPYCSIQTAIDNAVDTDEIIVAPGIYRENINFLGKAVTLRSQEGPEVTSIRTADWLVSTATCDSGEGPDTVLDGFEIAYGGAAWGAGMRNESSSPTVRRCIFRGNSAGAAQYSNAGCHITGCCPLDFPLPQGGAMANYPDSNPILIDCLFHENTALWMQGWCEGWGWVSVYGEGGAILGGGTLINCTFVGNSAGSGWGGAVNGGDTLVNCILWDNGNWPLLSGGSVSFSNIEGGWSGDGIGNIDIDPLFVDPGNGDLRLSPGSPCIDAGDNTAVPEGIDTDLDGNPRFVDDPDTMDTGYGDPPIVDMGALEYQIPCPWDLDGDGNVSVTDLLLVLASWGPCEGPGDCPADFGGDGFVNVVDLLALIGNWGPCPGVPCVWDVTGDGVVGQSDLHQVQENFGPCDGCAEDVNGDGMVNGQDAAAVATHFGPCP